VKPLGCRHTSTPEIAAARMTRCKEHRTALYGASGATVLRTVGARVRDSASVVEGLKAILKSLASLSAVLSVDCHSAPLKDLFSPERLQVVLDVFMASNERLFISAPLR
jgi:hypothetical protein